MGGFFMDLDDANAVTDYVVPDTKESGNFPYYVPEEKKIVFKGCGQVAQAESNGHVDVKTIQVQTSKKDSEPFFLKFFKDAELT
jgi:hypothetical protein